MEISIVRKRVQGAITTARDRAQRRRAQTAEAERAFDLFLEQVATPVTRQLATVLKAEGQAFTVFTPAGGLRLALDRTRDDYVEFGLDTSSDRPHVIARMSRTRGSRTLGDERPVKGHAPPDELTEDDVLTFLLDAITPWLER